MSNFEKYLDILNKGKGENNNPNSRKDKASPLRPKKTSSDRSTIDQDWDFKKSEMPFNFYSLLTNNNSRPNHSIASESAGQSSYNNKEKKRPEDLVINALQS
jgi:hypothetical protein